jgi:hypothetical protein
LKKKYLEPYDKFIKNISHKHKIDKTIEVYELIKNFKSEIKMLKIYFDSDKNLIIDSNNFLVFSTFLKIKKIIIERESDLSGILYIDEDLSWFRENEEKMLKSFRTKFHDAIKSMVKIIFLLHINFI